MQCGDLDSFQALNEKAAAKTARALPLNAHHHLTVTAVEHLVTCPTAALHPTVPTLSEREGSDTTSKTCFSTKCPENKRDPVRNVETLLDALSVHTVVGTDSRRLNTKFSRHNTTNSQGPALSVSYLTFHVTETPAPVYMRTLQ